MNVVVMLEGLQLEEKNVLLIIFPNTTKCSCGLPQSPHANTQRGRRFTVRSR